MSAKLIFRNALEFAVLFLLWEAGRAIIDHEFVRFGQPLAAPGRLTLLILVVAVAKTVFFGVENIRQLQRATDENWPYHRFILLLMVNIWQMITSFGLDFHLLHRLEPKSFAAVAAGIGDAELVFDFFYYSSLNFMFFGFGDVTPQTVAAKLLTLIEIALSFVTVIFLLSDFIALKESLRRPREQAPTDSKHG